MDTGLAPFTHPFSPLKAPVRHREWKNNPHLPTKPLPRQPGPPCLEAASKVRTPRRDECSLQFIENGNIPRKKGIPHTEEEGRWGQYIAFHVTGGLAPKGKLCSPSRKSTCA